jgi:hypothetical protein
MDFLMPIVKIMFFFPISVKQMQFIPYLRDMPNFDATKSQLEAANSEVMTVQRRTDENSLRSSISDEQNHSPQVELHKIRENGTKVFNK